MSTRLTEIVQTIVLIMILYLMQDCQIFFVHRTLNLGYN